LTLIAYFIRPTAIPTGGGLHQGFSQRLFPQLQGFASSPRSEFQGDPSLLDRGPSCGGKSETTKHIFGALIFI